MPDIATARYASAGPPPIHTSAEALSYRARTTSGMRQTKKRQLDQRDLGGPVLLRKIFRFPRRANHLYKLAPSRSSRGAARDVTNAGRDAVDADGA
jgi:hypothetical protein